MYNLELPRSFQAQVRLHPTLARVVPMQPAICHRRAHTSLAISRPFKSRPCPNGPCLYIQRGYSIYLYTVGQSVSQFSQSGLFEKDLYPFEGFYRLGTIKLCHVDAGIRYPATSNPADFLWGVGRQALRHHQTERQIDRHYQ